MPAGYRIDEGCSRRPWLEKKHPACIWQSVMRRLIRPFLAVLVAIILVAAPIAAQAVMPCHGQCDASLATQPDQGHAPAPCTSMAPCMNVLTCAPGIALPALQRAAAPPLPLLLITYWPLAHAPHGVIVEPGLDPPVTAA
jgi:hypothetical protein